MAREIWLVRHGETEWSKSGAHTGRTDIPLTENGRQQAAELGRYLAGRRFSAVLSSPLRRARETCELAGLGQFETIADLQEWDYGDYEGRTTAEIRRERPDWSLWNDGSPNGESIEQAGVRADRVIDRLLPVEGDVALFAHGHILRILAARWMGQPPAEGRSLALGTASLSTLGYEREARVLLLWNFRNEIAAGVR
jgi:broad specificity phosphatase PhoE